MVDWSADGQKVKTVLLPTWQHFSAEIAKAAEGEKDLLEICMSLRLVMALEGVECLMP